MDQCSECQTYKDIGDLIEIATDDDGGIAVPIYICRECAGYAEMESQIMDEMDGESD